MMRELSMLLLSGAGKAQRSRTVICVWAYRDRVVRASAVETDVAR